MQILWVVFPHVLAYSRLRCHERCIRCHLLIIISQNPTVCGIGVSNVYHSFAINIISQNFSFV
nr:MAG TPA: hypothetical protein [Caudoviricetes sp.]